MPRSRRRKGARAKGALSSVEQRRLRDGPEKRYYDPGKNPRPRNHLKDLKRAAAAPRHDNRRGS